MKTNPDNSSLCLPAVECVAVSRPEPAHMVKIDPVIPLLYFLHAWCSDVASTDDPHGKDSSCNPVAFPPAMEGRCTKYGKCKEQSPAFCLLQFRQ